MSAGTTSSTMNLTRVDGLVYGFFPDYFQDYETFKYDFVRSTGIRRVLFGWRRILDVIGNVRRSYKVIFQNDSTIPNAEQLSRARKVIEVFISR